MKKIYMILAAMTLLSMSLNAQRLPADKLGGFDFKPTGTARLFTPGGQFRMPSLGSGEYLFGAYTTDDFDATGIGMAGYYNQAQWVRSTIMFDLSEYQEHLGDSIIGFRFALAGSSTVNVQDFGIYPTSQNWFASDQYQIWNLGTLMSGNTNVIDQGATGTSTRDVTISLNTYTTTYTTTVDGVTLTTSSGDLGWGTTMHWNGTNTISVADGTITKIVINGNSTTYPVSRLSTTTGNYTTSNNVGTWTGRASNVVFNTSSEVYVSSVVVTVETSTTVTTNSVDVGRGATKSEQLPVSGWNMDYGFQNQMIYRAGQLAMANGAQITSVTFYPEAGIGIPFSGSQVIVRLANVTNDNFGTGTTGTKITSGLTTVATITPVADDNATAWKIDFDSPFTYNGGNLLVQMSCPGNGNFAHANFLGDNQSANVSLISTGASANQSSTGNTSTFLPKATFTFTGSINTPTYLTLQGGEWHDFFLDEPVEFNFTGDSIVNILVGYTYYQLYDQTFTPIAVNSNSTGHTHYDYMYARSGSGSSYSRGWWSDGVSGSSSSDRPGDMAVQLIFKSKMQKTPAPTITVTSDPGYYYVTATATDPNATVYLVVGGQTASGVGSVTIPVGRGNNDYYVTATATAQEEGKLVSDPTIENITIEASPLDPTPDPAISSQVHDLTVEVNGSGQGEVHMYVDGQEVPITYYLERGTEDYYVTVTVTAQIQDTQHSMSTTTQEVLVPKLDNLDELIDGWTLLPGTYSNDKVINWNDNLMFVDRFTASTAQNDHAPKYIYKMTENDTKLDGDLRSTNEHIIPVMHTGTTIVPYYTADDVAADVDREHVKPYVMNAKADMYLEHSSDIYYYTLDRSVNSTADNDYIELTKLQHNMNNTYTEMGSYYTYGETDNYGTWPRLDSIGVLQTGTYGTNFMTYVPIVWTLGNDPSNKRVNYDNDRKHNSYGAPIWMTGAPQVTVLNLEAQMQRGPNGSTQWDGVGGPCSLYFLGVEALGDVPSKTNIQCEPYMFRVWIQSPGNNLRGCTLIPKDENRPEKPGEHWEGDGTSYGAEPVLVYEGYTTDGHLVLDVEEPPMDNQPWGSRIQFGAIDNIPDLQVYVRFYYRSNGQAVQGSTNGYYLRANRDGGGFGAGEGGGNPGISTSIKGVYTDLNKPVESVTYVNAQGMQSSKPFDGINIVVTRYTDGTTRTTKVVR
ncbi:MAG: hypothetical protein IJV11_04230 [Muribaculaceae bacterium]|nr:hypothetical protein [Muribaculaceae bacterium]